MRLSRLESSQNPAQEPDFRSGKSYGLPTRFIKNRIPKFGLPDWAELDRKPNLEGRKRDPKRPGPSARPLWDPFFRPSTLGLRPTSAGICLLRNLVSSPCEIGLGLVPAWFRQGPGGPPQRPCLNLLHTGRGCANYLMDLGYNVHLTVQLIFRPIIMK